MFVIALAAVWSVAGLDWHSNPPSVTASRLFAPEPAGASDLSGVPDLLLPMGDPDDIADSPAGDPDDIADAPPDSTGYDSPPRAKSSSSLFEKLMDYFGGLFR
jgi:hypothetical protein